MNFYPDSFEEERLSFITGCIENDIPRITAETYPEDVKVISNIPYSDKMGYDIYIPENLADCEIFEEAFFLIHGGAFVYGVKENNKLFGTHLAKISGMPVINIDYSILPNVELIDVFAEIMLAADKATSKFGIKKLHLTGDSAGGYLSFVAAMIMSFDDMRKELGLTKNGDYVLASTSPICGCYYNPRDSFPAHYFEKEGVNNLPEYMYDTGLAVKKFGAPKTFIITGEMDFLLESNQYLDKVMNEMNIPHTYYMGKNADDRKMEHIFPIPHPEWPESLEVIEGMIKNAK